MVQKVHEISEGVPTMRRAILVLPLIALSLAACARNPDTPEGRAADARHEKFEEIGEAMKVIMDAAKAEEPDMAKLRASAETIRSLAPQITGWFPAGSGPDDGIHTHALQTVWTKPDEFKAAAAKLADESTRFQALVQAGDKAAIGAGVPALGGACKNCHDTFREKD